VRDGAFFMGESTVDAGESACDSGVAILEGEVFGSGGDVKTALYFFYRAAAPLKRSGQAWFGKIKVTSSRVPLQYPKISTIHKLKSVADAIGTIHQRIMSHHLLIHIAEGFGISVLVVNRCFMLTLLMPYLWYVVCNAR
jgi:hypothetical protein